MNILVLAVLGRALTSSAMSIAKDPPLTKPSAAERGKQFMDIVAPLTRPVTVQAKPRIRADAVRKKLLFGPYTIPAAKVLVQPLFIPSGLT